MKQVGKVNKEREWERVQDGQREGSTRAGIWRPHHTEEGWGQWEESRGGKEVSPSSLYWWWKGLLMGNIFHQK